MGKRGRPPKSEDDRKDVDLRIPVTTEQKDTIVKAATAAGEDMAAWARPILMQAAKKAVEAEKKK